MTKKLSIFLAFYLLAVQPALAWWLRDDPRFYQIAGFNAWICIIAYVISAICNCKCVKTEKEEKSEWEKNDITPEITDWNSETKESETAEEEKQEEKSDLKNEKVIKETVSIPKIVQPLAWHYTKSKKKKDIKYGQWLVLLCTLALAGLIARILWEFFGVRSVVIALLLGWIFYLIIWKLADIDGFYKAKKLFTNRLYVILILAWIWYGVYNVQQSENWFNSDFWIELKDKVITCVKDWFAWDKDNVSYTETWVVYVFEGTWEVLDPLFIEPDVDSLENENLSWEVLWENIDIADEKSEVTNTETEISEADVNKDVTMWEAIKHLLSNSTLSTKTTSTFKYVSKNSELYPYFKTAQEKWMIWTDTNPSKIVSCETYITMKWLSEWRNVWNYVKSEIRTAYWNKASELWKLNWCEKGKYLTQWTL